MLRLRCFKLHVCFVTAGLGAQQVLHMQHMQQAAVLMLCTHLRSHSLQEQRTWVEQPQHALTPYDAAAASSAAAHWQRLGLPPLQSSSTQQLNYYALLEVPRDASPEQVKRQYYQLARR